MAKLFWNFQSNPSLSAISHYRLVQRPVPFTTANLPLLGHAPSALASGKAPADVERLVFNPDFYKMHWTAELNTWWNFNGCLLDVIGDWFVSHAGKSILGTWTLWPVSSTMRASSFPAPGSWRFFLLAALFWSSFSCLHSFRLSLAMLISPLVRLFVDGVKQKGSVWWLSASYMRIRKSRWSKGMWPCPCNFRVKSCDPRSTNHPQQSPSHLPKRNSSDNRPKPWLRSTPKMSQWDSTALANNCFNKSLVRPSSWLATVLLKWADPTTRFCKAGTLKSNLPNIPLRAHCSDCKFSFTACTNCPLRIKKSSGIATANPDSATPTTLHPKVSKRCKSIGSHSCMAMYDQVPARKDEISIPWRTEPGFHDKPEMRLRSITQSPGMHLMLHCLLCKMETKNFGDFCGMASASAVDGNYILELTHDSKISRNIFRIRWSAAAAYTSAFADNPDFRVCVYLMFTTHKASGIVAPQRGSIAPLL